MTESNPPRPQPRVSNEVLEERVGQFYNHVNENLIGIRAALKALEESNGTRMGRLEDRVLLLDQRIQDHGQNPGHGESLLRIANLERVQTQIQEEMRALSKVAALETNLTRAEADGEILKNRITALERERDEQAGEAAGRRSTLGSADRLFMIIVAAVPTIVLILNLLEGSP